MKKRKNLQPDAEPTARGASARSGEPAAPESGIVPSSFEDWLSEDVPLISLESGQEASLPPVLPSEPENSGLEGDQHTPSSN